MEESFKEVDKSFVLDKASGRSYGESNYRYDMMCAMCLYLIIIYHYFYLYFKHKLNIIADLVLTRWMSSFKPKSRRRMNSICQR